MNDKDFSSYIEDILQALAYIEADIEGFNLERLRADRQTRQIVERNLEIISEASRHLPESCTAREASIPWRRIADFGNVFRHAYNRVELSALWRICQEDLQPLKAAMLRMQQQARRQ